MLRRANERSGSEIKKLRRSDEPSARRFDARLLVAYAPFGACRLGTGRKRAMKIKSVDQYIDIENELCRAETRAQIVFVGG